MNLSLLTNGISRYKRYLFFSFIVVLMLIPFSNKPFFIDDYYHYLMAKGIINNPLRPYDFLSDDDGHDNPGWEYGRLPRMVNPPVTHYLLAMILKFLGDSERLAHCGFIFFAALSAVSFLFIAEKFLDKSFSIIATLLFVFNPVFWITSTGLMLDSVKLTFYLLSIVFLISGVEKEKKWFLIASGIFMGFAILSKYTAFSVIPLSLIYLIMFDKNWKKNLVIFLVPFAMIVIWSIWNIATYGSPHLTSALRRTIAHSPELKVFVVLVFLSGGLIFPLGIWPGIFLSSIKKLKYLSLLSIILFVGGVWIFSSPYGGFTLIQSALLSLWFVTSINFIVSSAVSFLEISLEKKDIFILIWFALTFLTMLPAMIWTAGRYFMVVAPPATLVFVRLIQLLLKNKEHQLKSILYGSVMITFIMGILLTFTDYTQAGIYKKIKQDLKSDGIQPSYFKSDIFSGITGYLKSDGWRIVVPGEDILKPGDFFLIGYISTPVAWIKEPHIQGRLEVVKIYEYKAPRWLPFRVLSVPDSAGFYATCWGALPWSISTLPLERYKLHKIVP